jgi:cyclomaltodextrinase
MDDFVFGTLTSDESRLAHTRARLEGVTHAQRRWPRDPLPGQAVRLELTLGPAQGHSQAWVYWTTDGSDPLGAGGQAVNGHAAPLTPAGTEWNTLAWGYVRRFEGVIPGQPKGTVVRYRVAAGKAGAQSNGDEVLADAGAYYAYYVDDDPPPAWAHDAILYHIFVDRFYSPAPDFPRIAPRPALHGNGTLAGITAQLDYIAGLGVNCLWLSPIFPSPSYHGYDATDFFSIHPRLGTLEDFGALVDQAHSRGLRVLLDFVPNHWSNQHPTFVSAASDRGSPYHPWYTWDSWPDKYKTFFGVQDLPQINLRHAPARQHVLDAARYWLDFGVDGYRVDYCIGPTPDFYADFRRVTRAAKADCWTFGEAIDPPESQVTFEGGMDGALDFMLLEALRQTFAYDQWDARRFADFLDRHEAFFPPAFSRPSFLDNHDMNRFLWVVQGDARRLKLAALCQFTLAGQPIIYYGTEAGLSQQRDVRQAGWAIHEEARLPMVWGAQQDAELLDFYRTLCALRNAHPALRRGTRETLMADGGLLAYRRTLEAGSVVTALNLGAEPREVALPIGERTVLLSTDAASGAEADGSGVRVRLGARGGVVLRR